MTPEHAIVVLSHLRTQRALELDQAIAELATHIDAAADLQRTLAMHADTAGLSTGQQSPDAMTPGEQALIRQRARVEHAWKSVERARLRQQRTTQALQRASFRLRLLHALNRADKTARTPAPGAQRLQTDVYVTGAQHRGHD